MNKADERWLACLDRAMQIVLAEQNIVGTGNHVNEERLLALTRRFHDELPSRKPSAAA